MEKQWSYSTCWWITTSVGLQSAVSSANIGAAQQKSSNNSQSFGFCAGSYLQILENDLDLLEQTGFPKQTLSIGHIPTQCSQQEQVDPFVHVCLKGRPGQGKLASLSVFSQTVKTQTVWPLVIHRYFLFGSIKKKRRIFFIWWQQYREMKWIKLFTAWRLSNW